MGNVTITDIAREAGVSKATVSRVLNRSASVDSNTRERVEEVLNSFVGTIQQIPPVFSACKVDGKRAYELARKGEEVELKSKTLVIDEMELLECNLPVIKIRVVCSKGTYIRALARDIGVALNSGAHLIGLERTRIGDITLDKCMNPEDIDAFLDEAVEEACPRT